MLVIISAINHSNGESLFFRIILFIYFAPTIIAFFRSPIIKFKFFSVLFINLFFGWTLYGWWLAFAKAFSSREIINLKQKSQDLLTLDKYDQLNKLDNLRSKGIINEEEFEVEKNKILNL
ncbi:hypothetical protein BBI01_03680 [Chryseobacterium artocarpi]|uniref:SHOCT domain-containing protein n=1 Tax=Chryseobacterium artocarpi TaxID=1414727 RepID=A0A1B9A131_9FLAO|nr:superinfection immunity protein [Chryseobacterium artocarpi]OCA77560.1 hypothetical protein BBI01_03680 [Chryseobacterium artocarpi]